MGVGLIAWLIIATPEVDRVRAALAYVAAPALVVFGVLRLRAELRDRNER
jgi:hypothetical protein